MLGRIFGGIALIIVGSLIIYYYNQLYNMFGNIERAEKYIGDSRTIYVLFGCLLIVIGVLVIFGFGPSTPTDTSGFQYNA